MVHIPKQRPPGYMGGRENAASENGLSVSCKVTHNRHQIHVPYDMLV